MTGSWWVATSERGLSQGDLLDDCLMPVFVDEPEPSGSGEPVEQDVLQARLIVVSQSCDLVAKKVQFVALCPVVTLVEFESQNPRYAAKGRWESVRKGREPGLHLLAFPDAPDENH